MPGVDAAKLNVLKAREHFPALKIGYIFADNARGSQCLINKDVADRVSDYMLNTNVQLGADYSVSVESTNRVAEGASVAAALINASSPGEIAFGPSSTMLVENLSRAMDEDILDGEEIVIAGEHESNSGPWKKLAARRGLTIKTWLPTVSQETPNNPYSVELTLTTLTALLTEKTRLVAFTGCSNILGSAIDVAKVVSTIREVAANKGVRKVEVCVDCVAYAPHRRIDVQTWDVDYCFFSYYKMYGPHASVLYVRTKSLIASLSSLVHHFLKVDDKSYKLAPGGQGYELTYGTTGVLPYLRSLSPAGDIDDAFALIAAHEQALLQPLLGYLTGEEARARGVLIVGSERADTSRVSIVSFVVRGHRSMKSKDVVAVFDKKGKIGIRCGYFSAYTLVDTLQPKLDIDDGVVRISLVHYNTVEEVNALIEVLGEALA